VAKWVLLLTTLGLAGAAAWKEYPSLVRYLRIRAM
jgi:hypothetical protein